MIGALRVKSPKSLVLGLLLFSIILTYMDLCLFQIDLFHTDEALKETYSLMDVAYIYSWRRVCNIYSQEMSKINWEKMNPLEIENLHKCKTAYWYYTAIWSLYRHVASLVMLTHGSSLIRNYSFA